MGDLMVGSRGDDMGPYVCRWLEPLRTRFPGEEDIWSFRCVQKNQEGT